MYSKPSADATALAGTAGASVRELRMLDPVERQAARLASDNVPIGDIAAATGLTWQHIREAVALQARWRREPPPPGWDPNPQPEPDPDPLCEISNLSTPLPVDGSGDVGVATARQEDAERLRATAEGLQAEAERDAELEHLVQRRSVWPTPGPGNADLSWLVRAAEQSGDAHARTLAGRIRRLADELAAHLSLSEQVALAHQRISTLQTELDSLRRLARRREPLQAERVAAGAPRPGAAAVRGTAPATPSLKPTDDIRYSTAVREWARSQGMEVSAKGRLPSRVIDAWRAAHPSTPS